MTTDDRAEITRMIRANFAAFAAHSIDGMRVMDHPDGTIWDMFEPELFIGAEGRARFRKNDVGQSMRRGKLTINVEDPVLVDVWDDTALARYYLIFSYEPPNAMANRIRITDVFQRAAGCADITMKEPSRTASRRPPNLHQALDTQERYSPRRIPCLPTPSAMWP
ncbi:MAG: hypothetical protein EXQ85_10135 [Alphaproteobacteria bacterium]|nr:hypothetical protein [Alphaproteobacteria bacterium]